MSISGGLLPFGAVDERAEGFEVAGVVAGLVHGRLKEERGVREARVRGDAAQRLGADVAEAEVPVAVYARVVGGLRVVEVDGEHVLKLDVRVERVERGREAVFVAYVVAGREGVRGVEADAEVEVGAPPGDLAQVLEAVADALALPGRVLKEDAEGVEFEPFTRGLQTLGAGADGVRLAGAAGAARVEDEVVRAEGEPALDLLAERGDGL